MKKAILNDGVSVIDYNSVEELETQLMPPYNSFRPITEHNGLLIGREDVTIGTYQRICCNKEDVTNLDDSLV